MPEKAKQSSFLDEDNNIVAPIVEEMVKPEPVFEQWIKDEAPLLSTLELQTKAKIIIEENRKKGTKITFREAADLLLDDEPPSNDAHYRN